MLACKFAHRTMFAQLLDVHGNDLPSAQLPEQRHKRYSAYPRSFAQDGPIGEIAVISYSHSHPLVKWALQQPRCSASLCI
jgi:hypothetical protein